MEKLRYSEIFYSVQGEGRFVGVPSVYLVCSFGCLVATLIAMDSDRVEIEANG